VLLYFAAKWLEECKLMTGVLQELLKEENVSNSLKVIEIEAEDFEDVSIKHGVESVPTFVFLKVKLL
jgi:thioredoxin-like negative regulator of GroEL